MQENTKQNRTSEENSQQSMSVSVMFLDSRFHQVPQRNGQTRSRNTHEVKLFLIFRDLISVLWLNTAPNTKNINSLALDHYKEIEIITKIQLNLVATELLNN